MEKNQGEKDERILRVLEKNDPVYFHLLTNRYCMNRPNDARRNKCPETKVLSNRVCLGMEES